MKPSDSSVSTQSKGESPRLTAALAFGFAAGALFSRKPAAAIAAVATGLIACASTRRTRTDDAFVTTQEEPRDEMPPPSVAQSVPVIAAIQEKTPPIPLVQAAELSPLDPLPALGESIGCGEIAEATVLASLSLPELDSPLPDQPVITPIATNRDASVVKPRTQSPAPGVNHLHGKLTIALVPGVRETLSIPTPPKPLPVAAKKKSWMSWWQ